MGEQTLVTITDDLSERQNVSMMSDSGHSTDGLTQMPLTLLTTRVGPYLIFYPGQSQGSAVRVFAA